MNPALNADVRVFPDLDALSRAAAEAVMRLIDSCLKDKKRCAIALSGGHTPLRLHQTLAAEYGERIPWAEVHLFWGDERYVPPNSPESNFGAAEQTFVSHIGIPAKNVHRMPTHFSDPEEAAREYEKSLKGFFLGSWPRFDLILLGLGRDGHTASLFPGAPAVSETKRWVVAVRAGVEPPIRLTLTLPVFNHAANVYFLVAGADKAAPLRRALLDPPDPVACPAGAVRPQQGSTVWWMDKSAASLIAGRAAQQHIGRGEST